MNRLYPNAKELFLTKQLDWGSDPIKAILVNTSVYTYSGAHTTLTELGMSGTVATSGTLENRTATLGVADADNAFFAAVPPGTQANAVILAVDQPGTLATSYLVSYIDTLTGLPYTGDGGPAVIAWDNGTNRIFALHDYASS